MLYLFLLPDNLSDPTFNLDQSLIYLLLLLTNIPSNIFDFNVKLLSLKGVSKSMCLPGQSMNAKVSISGRPSLDRPH